MLLASDDDEVRADVVRKGKQTVDILGADIDAAAKRSHCRASWRDDEFLGQCRSRYRPGKRMLAAAAADQENFHRMVLLSGAGRCGLPGAQYDIRLSCHERGPAA